MDSDRFEHFEGDNQMIAEAQPANGIKEQLELLYADRERIYNALGISEPDDIIKMVRNLEAQLHDFYSRFGGQEESSTLGSTDDFLAQVDSLNGSLKGQFPNREVVLESQDGKPTIRAIWKG